MAAFRKNRLRLAGASSPSLVWRLCFLVRWNFCQREPRCVRWLYPLTVPFQAFAKAKPTTTQSQRRLTAHTIGLQQCCRASWSRRHGGQTKERAGGRVGSGDGRRDVAGGTEQTTQKGGGGGGGGGQSSSLRSGPRLQRRGRCALALDLLPLLLRQGRLRRGVRFAVWCERAVRGVVRGGWPAW